MSSVLFYCFSFSSFCFSFSSITYRRFRSRVRRVIDHIFFRAFTLILICIDLSIVIAAVVKSETAENPEDPDLAIELERLDYVALTFSSYFMVEVSLRIFAQT